MINYFVVFQLDRNSNRVENDILEHPQKIASKKDVREIEKQLAERWYGDDTNHSVTLTNFREL